MVISAGWLASVRYWVPRVVFVGAVLTQLYFIGRGYWDPHKHFAFQPFNESDRWYADIYRVTTDGQRHSADRDWQGYRWARLIRGDRGLDRPARWKRASSGMASTMVFLEQALNWVADNTSRDERTAYYEAHVTYFHNRRGPFEVVLRSHPRVDQAGRRAERLHAKAETKRRRDDSSDRHRSRRRKDEP